MRRYTGITITVLLAVAALIGLSAIGNVELDRPQESELNPIRSTYSSGPTGTRAFYQLLEESGKPVARWREPYDRLKVEAKNEMLVVVGPFIRGEALPDNEIPALQKWVEAGGSLLIISRHPFAQFGDPFIHSNLATKKPLWDASTDLLIDNKSDEYIQQPTDLTKGLQGLALSHLASRLQFYPPDEPDEEEDEPEKPAGDGSTSTPPPAASPATPIEEESVKAFLYAPVIHIGDQDGAILADFKYGEGRLVFLSDPFVMANKGIGRGANLRLALNLIESMSLREKGAGRTIFFDEYHHGFRSTGNPLIAYFRGTPMIWLLIHGLALSLILLYTFGRRFARPIPLAHIDRNSPLEFVDSMANLQQMARARDLAIENIYPRVKAQICRRLGVSSRASTQEIAARIKRKNIQVSEIELRKALSDSELILQGESTDDQELVRIIANLRQIQNRIG